MTDASTHVVDPYPASPAEIGLTKAATSLVMAAEALQSLAQVRQRSAEAPKPRRALNRVEAALYVGLSATAFDKLVHDAKMPKPVRLGTRVVWDIHALDAAFDRLAETDAKNVWDA
jgi:predicted DNA-binding transcriptional regulator AlpA